MADNTSTQTQQDPNDVLGQLMQAWAQNGGGNAAQGSMATNTQGQQSQIMSPGIAASSAQSIGGQQGNQGILNPSTGLNDNHVKILQGLIDKGTKQHAQDFLNTYGPQAAQNLVDTHNATSPTAQGQSQPKAQTQQAQPASTSASTQASAPIPNGSTPLSSSPDAIQQQAMKIATQKPGLLMSIFRGTFQNDNDQQLENLKQAQTITQGGPPLSPSEKTQAIGNWNSALLKQHQDFQSDLSDQMKSNVDAMESFVKNTPLPSKLADWTNYNKKLQDYHTNIRKIAETQLQGFNKYRNLQLTNPVTGQKGNKNFGVGDKVTYNGKERIIQSINEKNGRAVLSD